MLLAQEEYDMKRPSESWAISELKRSFSCLVKTFSSLRKALRVVLVTIVFWSSQLQMSYTKWVQRTNLRNRKPSIWFPAWSHQASQTFVTVKWPVACGELPVPGSIVHVWHHKPQRNRFRCFRGSATVGACFSGLFYGCRTVWAEARENPDLRSTVRYATSRLSDKGCCQGPSSRCSCCTASFLTIKPTTSYRVLKHLKLYVVIKQDDGTSIV